MIFIINRSKLKEIITKNFLKKVLILFIWLFIWYVASLAINKEIIFPNPILVFFHLIKLIFTYNFWVKIITSLLKVLLAYILAIFVGAILGLLSHLSKFFCDLISPIMSILKSTPIPSITLLFLFYIKSKYLSIFVSFVMVMPLFWHNVKTGLASIDNNLIEMSNTFNFSFKNKLIHIFLPSTLPYFFSAAQSGIGLAWKAGISSEIISYPINSIGRMINDSKVYLDSKGLFAWTIVVIILCIIFEKLIANLIIKASKKLRFIKAEVVK